LDVGKQRRLDPVAVARKEIGVRGGQPQQHGTINNLELALDRVGRERHSIEVEVAQKRLQQVGELVRQDRCRVLHLLPESYRFEPWQKSF
jgi:hypothetical protein